MRAAATSLPLRSLQRRWSILAAVGLAGLVGGYAFLIHAWQPVYAWRWLIISSSTTLYILWMVRENLHTNTRLDDPSLLPYLGAGNVVSLARGMLIALVMGFVFSPRPPGGLAWIPGLLYTAAVLLDSVDGYLARRLDQSTRLGEILDMNFDGLGVLAATSLVVLYGQVPVWYLLVGLARYLFLFGIWLRRQLSLPVYDLSPNFTRRALAGLQMGYMFVMLWPLFGPPGTRFVSYLFATPFLAHFLWDWLTVCGTVNQPGTTLNRLEAALHHAKRLSITYVPLALRLGVVLIMFDTAMRWLTDWNGQVSIYSLTASAQGMRMPELLLVVWALLEWLVIGLIAAGAAGRITAIVGLCLVGLHQLYLPLSAAQYLLAGLLTGILVLGTGTFSLWKPEDWVLFRKLGERPRQPAEAAA